jgi:cholesterol transport system auxiliary component
MSRSMPRASLAAAAGALLLGACISLPKPEPVDLYLLDPAIDGPAAPGTGPVLLVSAPRAAPGFEGPRIAWVREPHQLRYFARSQWAEPPARMLGPLLVRALEHTGRFQAITDLPGAAAAGLRLDTELVRLQQEFASRPSQVRVTLRVQLVDAETRRILGTGEFEAVEPAASEDPAGGVAAASRAVGHALSEVAAWTARLVPEPRSRPAAGQ